MIWFLKNANVWNRNWKHFLKDLKIVFEIELKFVGLKYFDIKFETFLIPVKIDIEFETLKKLSMVFETVIGNILDKNQCLQFDLITWNTLCQVLVRRVS